MPRRRFYCLRDLRKRLGKYRGTQRGLRKRLGKYLETCAACANASANAAGLARLAQTSRQIPWDLRGLRKCLGKYRGTQRGLRKRLGKCRGTQRGLRKRFGKCRGTQRDLRKPLRETQ